MFLERPVLSGASIGRKMTVPPAAGSPSQNTVPVTVAVLYRLFPHPPMETINGAQRQSTAAGRQFIAFMIRGSSGIDLHIATKNRESRKD
jgi:hypothetical protein